MADSEESGSANVWRRAEEDARRDARLFGRALLRGMVAGWFALGMLITFDALGLTYFERYFLLACALVALGFVYLVRRHGGRQR